MTFLWIKAFHIIAVITWFAALFYLPRLFVYHTMSEDEISRDRFKIMERKLLRGIANPSMIATRWAWPLVPRRLSRRGWPRLVASMTESPPNLSAT